MRASPVATKSELSESTETRNRALARVRRLRLRIAVSRLRLTEGVVLLLLLRRFLFSPLAPALRLYFSSRRKVPKAARPEPGWQGRRCYHAAAPDPRSSQTSQFGIVAQAAKAACALCLIGTPGCCIRHWRRSLPFLAGARNIVRCFWRRWVPIARDGLSL